MLLSWLLLRQLRLLLLLWLVLCRTIVHCSLVSCLLKPSWQLAVDQLLGCRRNGHNRYMGTSCHLSATGREGADLHVWAPFKQLAHLLRTAAVCLAAVADTAGSSHTAPLPAAPPVALPGCVLLLR